MKSKILLLTLLPLLIACNPLRKVQQSKSVDSTSVDKSEIRKLVTEAIKEQGTFRQVVVEYYPPVVSPATDSATPTPSGPTGIRPDLPTVTTPAIKRIIKTEIATTADKTTTTDSIAKNNVTTTLQSNLTEKVVEKPPATVTAIKWIAIGLAAILLIIIAIKFLR